MSIAVIGLSECKDGYILAEDVYNREGVLIVAAYTPLNSYIIEKLYDFRVQCIKVFMPESDVKEFDSSHYRKKYEEKALMAKELLTELSTKGKLDMEKLSQLSESIFNEIMEDDYILNCLNEIKNSDEYTYNHSLNVALYAALIGRWLKLSESEIIDIIQGSLLHDIGKTKISSEILNKPGKLLPREWEEVKRHPIYGYEMIKPSKHLNQAVKQAVLTHHEREDGSGYPLGFKGEQLNVYEKIIAIGDVYDAMVSERVYKKKSTPFEAFEMFLTEGIGLFDLTIMNTFLKRIAPYYIGAKVELSTGEKGEVIYIPPHALSRPVIKVGSKYIDIFNHEEKITINDCYFE